MENKPYQADLKSILTLIWKRRKFILITTAITLVLGVVIAYTRPPSYQAGCVIVPQNAQNKEGNLNGLATMVGINVENNTMNGNLSPAIYTKILKSVPFCKEIMQTKIVVERSNNQPITLAEYYSDGKYQKTNVMAVVKQYTIGLPSLIFRSRKKPKTASQSHAIIDSLTHEVVVLNEIERNAIGAIKQSSYLNYEQTDGYISIGYTFAEPEAAAIIAQRILEVLEEYVKSYKSKQQLEKLQFIEESYAESRKDFIQKQSKLATYQDANLNLVSAGSRAIEKRLASEHDIAFTIYNELAKQLEQARISLKETMATFAVIEPVILPQTPSGPRRGMIILVFIFIGFVGATAWVIAKPFVIDLKNEIVKG